MRQIIADTHTHTIVSGDAHSTLLENITAARDKGLLYLCATDHVCSIPRAPRPEYFMSLCSVPREYEGVTLLRGVEANILDYDGALDVPERILDWLDWVIASLHDMVIAPAGRREHTRAWRAVAENPCVDVIGHCGDPRYHFDLDEVIPAFGRCGKLVEINSHSFEGRKGSAEGCEQVARKCMQYGVSVVVSSDAHFAGNVGNFRASLEMLERIGFPEELVLNADAGRFRSFALRKRNASA